MKFISIGKPRKEQKKRLEEPLFQKNFCIVLIVEFLWLEKLDHGQLP